MVQHLDAKRRAQAHQFVREDLVLDAGGRIAARMIVRNNHGLRINLQRRREDLPDLNSCSPMVTK